MKETFKFKLIKSCNKIIQKIDDVIEDEKQILKELNLLLKQLLIKNIIKTTQFFHSDSSFKKIF
jgi:hypothetical protein